MNFDASALNNLVSALAKTQGGTLGNILSALGGSSSGGGLLGGLAKSIGGSLLGGDKGDILAKAGTALSNVLGSGAFTDQAKNLFSSNILSGLSVADVAKKFGVAEGEVTQSSNGILSAVAKELVKLV